jgi:hypothetical protein
MDGGLDNSTSGFGKSVEIFLWDSTSAEEASICEVLSSKISNRELGEDDLGSRLDNLLKLVVNEFPLSINDLLVIVGVLKSDLGVFFL